MSKIFDLIQQRNGIDQLATDLLRGSKYLMDDLENGFDYGRGKKVTDTGYQFIFQEEGIEAKLWLMNKMWNQIRDLHALVKELGVYVEEHDDQIDAALKREAANAGHSHS